jgi:hypothetical protein
MCEYLHLREENEVREEASRWRYCTSCQLLLCSSCEGEGCALEDCNSLVCDTCAQGFRECTACKGNFCGQDNCESEHRRRKRCFAEHDSEFTSQLPSPVRPKRKKQSSMLSMF